MNIWFTADLHLGHANIIKYCDRPFKDVEHMNTTLIKKWNERVKPKDTVFHVGDFCFKSANSRGEGQPTAAIAWEKQLNGKIIFIQGNHDCFSMNTRLLTKQGYKYHHEVKIGDLIPTVNLKTNSVEYKPIKNVVLNRVDEVYGFKTMTAEGLFSNNHNHIVVGYNKARNNLGKISKIKSAELWKRKSHLLLPSSWGSNQKRLNINNDWLKLLAWIYTDGGIEKRYKYITIYQSKDKYVKEIKLLLEKLKIPYKIRTRIRNITEICGKKVKSVLPSQEFLFSAINSRTILTILQIKHKYHIPNWLNSLSDKQARILIDEMIKGDGSIANSGSRVLWGQKEFLEHIMGFCVTHGMDTNLIKDSRGAYYLCIHIRKKKTSFAVKQINSKNRFVHKTNENMWCVNVENHIIFTELNGKTLITGNSNNTCKTPIRNITIWMGSKRIQLIHNPEHIIDGTYDMYFVGHVHNNWKYRSYKCQFGIARCINVGVDVNNFYPISFNEVLKVYHKNKEV